MVVFRGTGIGAQGRMEYAFTLKLFDGVELKNVYFFAYFFLKVARKEKFRFISPSSLLFEGLFHI